MFPIANQSLRQPQNSPTQSPVTQIVPPNSPVPIVIDSNSPLVKALNKINIAERTLAMQDLVENPCKMTMDQAQCISYILDSNTFDAEMELKVLKFLESLDVKNFDAIIDSWTENYLNLSPEKQQLLVDEFKRIMHSDSDYVQLPDNSDIKFN